MKDCMDKNSTATILNCRNLQFTIKDKLGVYCRVIIINIGSIIVQQGLRPANFKHKHAPRNWRRCYFESCSSSMTPTHRAKKRTWWDPRPETRPRHSSQGVFSPSVPPTILSPWGPGAEDDDCHRNLDDSARLTLAGEVTNALDSSSFDVSIIVTVAVIHENSHRFMTIENSWAFLRRIQPTS